VASFKAIVIRKSDGGQTVALSDVDENELMEGDVTFRVEWSTINYKDGLAITGKAPVVRRFPMIAGIDAAGTVETSSHPEWKPGDKVVLNGWGCGETHLGGHAEKMRCKGDWLVPLPATMTARNAMAIGTAGYTAMLAVLALEREGVTADRGPVIVTGASGGVGSVAVAILAKLGHHVVAATGRPQEADYLKELGAAEVIARQELTGPVRPLGKERWAGGVDAVGVSDIPHAHRATERVAVGAGGDSPDERAVPVDGLVAEQERSKKLGLLGAEGGALVSGRKHKQPGRGGRGRKRRCRCFAPGYRDLWGQQPLRGE